MLEKPKGLKMIVAVDEKWGIGKNNKLLTYLPTDLAYFKKKTLGGLIIIGKNTAISFPHSKALPGRVNLVISSSLAATDDFVIVNSIDNAFQYIEKSINIAHAENRQGFDNNDLIPNIPFDKDKIFVCGGESIYKQFLKYVSTIYVTKIKGDFDADTFFINLDESGDFKLINESKVHIEKKNNIEFTFCEYTYLYSSNLQ